MMRGAMEFLVVVVLLCSGARAAKATSRSSPSSRRRKSDHEVAVSIVNEVPEELDVYLATSGEYDGFWVKLGVGKEYRLGPANKCFVMVTQTNGLAKWDAVKPNSTNSTVFWKTAVDGIYKRTDRRSKWLFQLPWETDID